MQVEYHPPPSHKALAGKPDTLLHKRGEKGKTKKLIAIRQSVISLSAISQSEVSLSAVSELEMTFILIPPPFPSPLRGRE